MTVLYSTTNTGREQSARQEGWEHDGRALSWERKRLTCILDRLCYNGPNFPPGGLGRVGPIEESSSIWTRNPKGNVPIAGRRWHGKQRPA